MITHNEMLKLYAIKWTTESGIAVKNDFWHHETETNQAVVVYATDTSIINTESFLRSVNCTIARYSNLAVRTIRFLY